MQGEFKVSRCTRRCHALERPLREGEWYYSVLVESGDEFLRRDYAAEAWQGPPEEAIGWWKNRMPTSDEKKLVLAPKEVLIDLLRQMADDPAKAKSRYLLALLLMRRRIVKPAIASPGQATNDPTHENDSVLCVEVLTDGSQIEVPVCDISRGEATALREELNELIYCEAEE